MKVTTHALVEQYLRRLEVAARSLPRQPREELMAQIREHLADGIPPDATEADVRNVLDSLGEPDDIVAAARPDGPASVRRGPREILAVLLLLTGFPPFLGWIVGLGLLLWSPLWTARQKLLGALVWPGGFMVTLLGAGGIVVRSSSSTVCPAHAATAAPVAGAVQTTVSTLGSMAQTCTSAGGSSPWAAVGLALLFGAPVIVAVYLYIAAGRNPVNA